MCLNVCIFERKYQNRYRFSVEMENNAPEQLNKKAVPGVMHAPGTWG
jgi:hypothetical protein